MTLDSFIQKAKVDKIDIEGFEYEALGGAKKTLEKAKKIVLEYYSKILRNQCLEIIRRNRFLCQEKGTLIFAQKKL